MKITKKNTSKAFRIEPGSLFILNTEINPKIVGLQNSLIIFLENIKVEPYSI